MDDKELILPRHEQGLIHAAEGYARSTGKVGVCLVTSGPGATNLVTGIADANYDGIPLVCFTGQVATSVIGNDVSILQGVTLGGTGKESGDRHPKVREGVMIGAGAKILGNIEVGKYAKIGANSVVLQPVPEYATAAGVPAKIISKDKGAKPAFEMNQYFIDDAINLNI